MSATMSQTEQFTSSSRLSAQEALRSIMEAAQGLPASPTTSPKMSIRVAVIFKTDDSKFNAGHEVLEIDPNLDYDQLKHTLSSQFKKIYTGNYHSRSNVDSRYPWGKDTSIVKIQAVGATFPDPDFEATRSSGMCSDDTTILTRENCKAVLGSIHEKRGHNSLVVTAERKD